MSAISTICTETKRSMHAQNFACMSVTYALTTGDDQQRLVSLTIITWT